MGNKFLCVDPAPPSDEGLSEEHHISCLMDPSISLFQRYGSLFALRDRGTDTAVLGLCKVLLEDRSSALLRHEIAFVLGQLQKKNRTSSPGILFAKCKRKSGDRHSDANIARWMNQQVDK